MLFLAALPFAGLLGAEGAARLPLWYPGLFRILSGKLFQRYRTYYFDFDRDVLQFNPACARYDPDLFYTLKPGTCTFTNREFSVTFRVNSLGVRDDDASLTRPQVVVLGDSQALGWAVDEPDTFAAILERQSGMRVLNTAVSSYGTARELTMLGKVDRANLRYVVLQYCDNNLEENEEFLAHGNRLPIQSREAYGNVTRGFHDRRKPWLSAYLLRGMLGLGLTPTGGGPDAPTAASTRREVSAFVRTLTNAAVSWDGLKLVVFEVDGNGGNNPLFAAELRKQLDDARNEVLRSAAVLDLAPALTPEYYYLLDDHMNPRGHQLVASKVLPLLSR